ncbi:hypothetical protein [Brevibacillus brevis]|uniref:hypothetical protein n=1 Tax=Brevibacillus brevis TaxID=1393 RepID=UPI0025A4FB71|nr:hypothetical protein [Brevibacillus brevis]WJQ82705.1 hypothetical protein QN310_06105 [Brevibacillus brevis]
MPVRAVANAAVGKVEWIEATQDVRVNGNDLNEKLISGLAYAPARSWLPRFIYRLNGMAQIKL